MHEHTYDNILSIFVLCEFEAAILGAYYGQEMRRITDMDRITTVDYDPSDTSHMAEAISEASKDDQEIIRDYIEQRDWAKLGQKLYVMSYDYMEHFAQMEAQREVSNGLWTQMN